MSDEAELKKLTPRQAFNVCCWSGVLFMPFGDFWEMAEECLEGPIINHEFAGGKVWELLKERTKDEFNVLVGQEVEL